MIWPSLFPAPKLDSYASEREKTFIRTEMESGFVRQRQVLTNSQTALNVSWIMDILVFDLFESWFKYKINQGASWFSMRVPNGITDFLDPTLMSEVRFKGTYRSKRISDKFLEVTAELEVRDLPVLSEELYDDLIEGDFDLAKLRFLSDRFHTLVNKDIPTKYRWFN